MFPPECFLTPLVGFGSLQHLPARQFCQKQRSDIALDQPARVSAAPATSRETTDA
jgi:hypothetical protein